MTIPGTIAATFSLLGLFGLLALWVERERFTDWFRDFVREISQSWDVTP